MVIPDNLIDRFIGDHFSLAFDQHPRLILSRGSHTDHEKVESPIGKETRTSNERKFGEFFFDNDLVPRIAELIA